MKRSICEVNLTALAYFPLKGLLYGSLMSFGFVANFFAHNICSNKLKHGMFIWW